MTDTAPTDTDLRSLADRLAVQDVMIRYATSVDARDMKRYASCFTADVEVAGFGNTTFSDRGVYVDWVIEALKRYERTQHLIGNQEVVLDGDRAHLRSYVQATHLLADDPTKLMVLWAVYDDQLVRTAEGWQITRHELQPLIAPSIIDRTPR